MFVAGSYASSFFGFVRQSCSVAGADGMGVTSAMLIHAPKLFSPMLLCHVTLPLSAAGRCCGYGTPAYQGKVTCVRPRPQSAFGVASTCVLQRLNDDSRRM